MGFGKTPQFFNKNKSTDLPVPSIMKKDSDGFVVTQEPERRAKKAEKDDDRWEDEDLPTPVSEPEPVKKESVKDDDRWGEEEDDGMRLTEVKKDEPRRGKPRGDRPPRGGRRDHDDGFTLKRNTDKPRRDHHEP